MRTNVFAFLILTACLVGCGEKDVRVDVVVPPAVEQIKVELKNIAEAGEMDSGVLYGQELAQEIAAADASKAGLVKACKELESAKGKKDIEENVQAILSMLE